MSFLCSNFNVLVLIDDRIVLSSTTTKRKVYQALEILFHNTIILLGPLQTSKVNHRYLRWRLSCPFTLTISSINRGFTLTHLRYCVCRQGNLWEMEPD